LPLGSYSQTTFVSKDWKFQIELQSWIFKHWGDDCGNHPLWHFVTSSSLRNPKYSLEVKLVCKISPSCTKFQRWTIALMSYIERFYHSSTKKHPQHHLKVKLQYKCPLSTANINKVRDLNLHTNLWTKHAIGELHMKLANPIFTDISNS